ncbi:MAG: hypothetical protein AB8I08_09280 [Sandaracinaceae bacterium]
MRTFVTTLLVMFALAGCAADNFDTGSDLAPGTVASAKADGAFGSEELELGRTARGSTGGDGLVLYAIDLEEASEIQVTITRTGGDLRPSAYLYRGTEMFLAPDSYDAGADEVTLNYVIAASGEHHVVVKAYRGEGAGDFELSVTCIGGMCAGIPADPIVAQGLCIETAARCAIDTLPRFNGAVGAVRASSIFNGCLEDAGAHCADACDGEGEAVCDTIIAELPGFADQSAECMGVMTSCLSSCSEFDGYYTAYDITDTAASACWTGYNGNCLELVAGHASCGGDEYTLGSVGECRATCGATEGAFDEGPWDGCMETCEELLDEVDDFIREVADDAGEYFRPDGVAALAPTTMDALPSDVRRAAGLWISDWNEDANAAGRTDTADLSEEAPYTITRDGEVVGYAVGVWYMIDDSRFDGGGTTLYYNLEGELVLDVEWWG